MSTIVEFFSSGLPALFLVIGIFVFVGWLDLKWGILGSKRRPKNAEEKEIHFNDGSLIYRVLKENDFVTLRQKVDHMSCEGYVPVGGIVIYKDSSDRNIETNKRYCQVLVKGAIFYIRPNEDRNYEPVRNL